MKNHKMGSFSRPSSVISSGLFKFSKNLSPLSSNPCVSYLHLVRPARTEPDLSNSIKFQSSFLITCIDCVLVLLFWS